MMRRVLFKNILGIKAFWIPVRTLVRLTKQNVILPFYHAVSDEDLAHLKYSYNIKTISQFIKDLDFLLKSFSPVNFSDLKDFITGIKKLKKPVMALSFDDGLKEVHDVIAPILIQKGIPATIFINPEFVDNQGLFYKYKANLIINRLDRADHPGNLYEIINSRLGTDIRRRSHMIRTILNIGYEQQDILDAIAELVDLNFSTFLKIRKPYLTVEQITRLQELGFRIGSHSLDHPLYSGLNLEEQLEQTKKSLEWVTETFDLDYRYFSFPFTDDGVSGKFFEIIFNPDEPVADMVFGTAGMKKTAFPFHFQRIPLEDSKLKARFFIRGEYVYYISKGIAGRNVRKI
jgi:peptidoglycan/xylan/chitin deacetylase (PgdA/CDA1 family)